MTESRKMPLTMGCGTARRGTRRGETRV